MTADILAFQGRKQVPCPGMEGLGVGSLFVFAPELKHSLVAWMMMTVIRKIMNKNKRPVLWPPVGP